MSASIRPAALPDAPAMARIYNEGIAGRQATFETRTRGADEVVAWLGERGPVLVADDAGRILGFARVSAYSDREVYAGVGEYGIYVATAARRTGVGARLLHALVPAAEAAGYHKLTAKLFTTNAASLALARRCGFTEVGVHRRHARLDGEWRDVMVVERLIGESR
ncbi:MAG: arsinothricin resistance N-acetyltransferase ArsN1 family A [Solirubrobacteraceae bacterium]